MASKEKNRSLVAPGQLISAILYAALIGVVNYGRHHYVYDGFSEIVPYIIMLVFAVMSFVRLVGFFRSVKAQSEVKKFNRMRSGLDLSEPPEDEPKVY